MEYLGSFRLTSKRLFSAPLCKVSTELISPVLNVPAKFSLECTKTYCHTVHCLFI